MERTKLKKQTAQKALQTLEEILEQPYSVMVRDASIQRFEYTFEALWKFLKEYLKNEKGIICNAPKDCIREVFAQGFLSEEETEKFLMMADSRNETSHTYNENIAEKIYNNLHSYFLLMNSLMKKL